MILLIGLFLLCGAEADVVREGGSFFVASSRPADGSAGITIEGGVTFLKADGTFRVLNSSDGVPVSLIPGQTAVSPILVDSQDANFTISTTTAIISGYMTPYLTFLGTGGYFNRSISVNGSLLTDVSVLRPLNNTVRPLNSTEKYVLVLGNTSAATNATYKIRSTGTRTLPGGQIVTAILSPGNLAVLSHLNQTGSATIDLQVQQLTANANGVVDFFLVDQQQAIQLQSADYVARTIPPQTQSTTSSAAVQYALPTTSPSNSTAATSSPVPQTSQAPAPPSPNLFITAASGGSTSVSSASPNAMGPPSPPSALGVGQTSPLTVTINTGVRVPVGTAISLQISLKDYIGELYLFAYYLPSASNGGVSNTFRYSPPTASDPQVLVSAAFRQSSTVLATPSSPSTSSPASITDTRASFPLPPTPVSVTPPPTPTVETPPATPMAETPPSTPMAETPPSTPMAETPPPTPTAAAPPPTPATETPPPTPMPLTPSPPPDPCSICATMSCYYYNGTVMPNAPVKCCYDAIVGRFLECSCCPCGPGSGCGVLARA